MSVLDNPAAWPWLGLMVGFYGTGLVFVVVIAVTNCRIWHERFHVARGIRRIGPCDHCSDEWR